MSALDGVSVGPTLIRTGGGAFMLGGEGPVDHAGDCMAM